MTFKTTVKQLTANFHSLFNSKQANKLHTEVAQSLLEQAEQRLAGLDGEYGAAVKKEQERLATELVQCEKASKQNVLGIELARNNTEAQLKFIISSNKLALGGEMI